MVLLKVELMKILARLTRTFPFLARLAAGVCSLLSNPTSIVLTFFSPINIYCGDKLRFSLPVPLRSTPPFLARSFRSRLSRRPQRDHLILVKALASPGLNYIIGGGRNE